MKILISVTTFLIVSLIIFRLDESASQENLYRQNISLAIQGDLTGPDKARMRDVIMTMNPRTGGFNPKELSRIWREGKNTREQELRDFQWEPITTDIAGRVRSLMIDPNDENKLWGGSVTGGLWYTSDFRSNSAWQNVSDQWENQSVSCITSDPNNSSIYYVGTGESFTSVSMYRESSSVGAGIYKSTDAGSSWSLMPSTVNFDYVNDILVRDEDSKSVIYVAVASGKYQGKVFNSTPTDGLFRSADHGITWRQVLPNIVGSSVPYTISDIELTSNGRIFVGTMRNLELKGGGKILYSDNGIDWIVEDQFVTDIIFEAQNDYDLALLPGRVILKSSPSNGDRVYAIATAGWTNELNQIRDHGFFTRIRQSSNHGVNWDYLEGPAGNWASIPWHALAMDVDPNDENKIVIGGLELFSLSNADEAGALNWIQLSAWNILYHFSDYTKDLHIDEEEQTLSDSLLNHFVHPDIHVVQFVSESSNEVLFSTDGGVQFTGEMTKSSETLVGDRLVDYPTFIPINNSFGTTQYYTVALDPTKGSDLILAGSQDNCTHITETTSNLTYANMISGGDGAYAFFDEDDPDLRITSSQVNEYYFLYENEINYVDTVAGTFINPGAYDDRSNLLYTNLASDGGYEALLQNVSGRYLDMVGIINVNEFLGKDKVGLETFEFLKLGTNSSSAFSAMKISPHSPTLDATMILGNQFGDVYSVSGLPYAPLVKKIDGNKLPVGYISSIDIGDSNNDILITFSNYGVESVWHTSNSGFSWLNLDRNLPDIPVRHGIFNPLDDQQLMIATEAGVWGLENIQDVNEEWQQYSDGFPNVRVDMLAVRGSDSVIVAATHGRGLFKGKFTQGVVLDNPLAITPIRETLVYPNPATDKLYISTGDGFQTVKIYDMLGKTMLSQKLTTSPINVQQLTPGVYIVDIANAQGKHERIKVQIR